MADLGFFEPAAVRRRRLRPSQRALVAVVYLREHATLAKIAAGFGISGYARGSHPLRRNLRLRLRGGHGQHRAGPFHVGLLQLPFQACMFRPGLVQPVRGMPSKTLLHRVGHLVTAPLFPLLRRFAPDLVTTTEALGRAMIAVVAPGAGVRTRVLRPQDINRLAQTSPDQR